MTVKTHRTMLERHAFWAAWYGAGGRWEGWPRTYSGERLPNLLARQAG